MTTSMFYLNGQEAALVKLGFMGLTPKQWQHTGLRATGGGAAGAGIGALAADDNEGMHGALRGGLAGAAGAGGISYLKKLLASGLNPMRKRIKIRPEDWDRKKMLEAMRVNDGLKGSAIGQTVTGGAAMGAIPAILAGRATRDND